ncbi:methyltransferase [Archaeoglobus sulfaticallidus PM70-1]|uniref:tRNA(Phe) (4-demethylwyosine(37)-C(7)) aminocarboxypropyltransferase n=1 Tax=Archaeoglobus sulfaticallidus PM70-1 TaxID=387631 RepID=N0BDE7_9EURY|nr:class I SAM-dependent methyltransferase family protein [Archaeoglobus sulfaticallidus]AGK61654.1 methyltransferase [Archaeoglobus sulfaticallidus PM70-1]
MKGLALKVPKRDAEKVRKKAESIGAKDKNRLIRSDGEFVYIPILTGFERYFDYEVVYADSPLSARHRRLEDYLIEIIPKDLLDFIPKSYKMIGEIILVKIADELEAYRKAIGECLLRLHPNCKSVWRDLGKEDMLRKPRLEFLAGDESYTETVKLENGCYFKLDVKKVMYSVGNQHEKMRIARLVEDGEIVVDMFAGIGYFSIPIAKHSNAKRIYSIEINPESYHYLLENIRLNEVDNVIPILGDSMFVTPPKADRIIMGHIYCHEFLKTAFLAVDEGYIHYHEAVPLAVKDRPVNRINEVAEKLGKKVKIEGYRKVKNYSPGVIHAVVDVYVY